MTGRILLIDDNPQIGRIFDVFLLKTRFSDAPFLAVYSLKDALLHIAECEPALIILDNYLGLYENFREPLQEIRKISMAPVVLLTGSELSELGLAELPDCLAGYIWKVGMTPENIEATLLSALQKPAVKTGSANL